ncbi:MAG: hypothetical protein Q7K57_47195 [Burkholderiaceae bacterium]|nr:hypothetical protein [Burkholderiaceae bacterium]
MHIAIDDTYGPEASGGSVFISGSRRTHVAVVFPDSDTKKIREQVAGCLEEIRRLTGVAAKEFHFVDIYNRNAPWNNLADHVNLQLFSFFALIYKRYQWPVVIQTIDNRTLKDHGIEKLVGKIEGLDLSKRSDLSLLLLLIKIKFEYKQKPEPIRLFIDEGRRRSGASFGAKIFHDWPLKFQGEFSSSVTEPLVQIADFIAFCINRSTHLATKKDRTEIDNWFLNLVGTMCINCKDLRLAAMPATFAVAEFDELHIADRVAKGL